VATIGGRYSVFLPPGTFDVLVVPSEDSGLSMTNTRLEVAGPPVRVQAGQTRKVVARTKVSGTCLVDDGRPLAGAEVEAAPAVELVPSLDPSHWPRPVRTQTADDGSYTLLLDQGTYDIIVRPASDSRLPWTISTSHHVGADALHLDPIRVLAPVGYDLTLHAPDDFSPIVRAVVRAFAFPGNSDAASPVAIELGRWITGFDGRFQMFVSPPQ